MLDLPDLSRIALELLQQIPKGKVTTYQALAIALGDKMAARVVPSLIAPHENMPNSLVYKVVQSDGTITGRTDNEKREKEKKLQAEDIFVKNGQVFSLSQFLFRNFQCESPLVKLQQMQLEARETLSLQAGQALYKTVGGIDLSYAGSLGVAAYVTIELPSRELVYSEIEAQEVQFPYIPSYLAFRELPLMLTLMQKLRDSKKLADITLVDGNGTLHHRHAGIACQLGVMLDIATIGITKSLLYGHPEKDLGLLRPGDICYIEADGEKLGAAIQSKSRAEPFFVSPGHKIDLETAIEIARAGVGEGRLPEPIQLAHNASREAAQLFKSKRAMQMKTFSLEKPSSARSAPKSLFDKT